MIEIRTIRMIQSSGPVRGQKGVLPKRADVTVVGLPRLNEATFEVEFCSLDEIHGLVKQAIRELGSEISKLADDLQ